METPKSSPFALHKWLMGMAGPGYSNTYRDVQNGKLSYIIYVCSMYLLEVTKVRLFLICILFRRRVASIRMFYIKSSSYFTTSDFSVTVRLARSK